MKFKKIDLVVFALVFMFLMSGFVHLEHGSIDFHAPHVSADEGGSDGGSDSDGGDDGGDDDGTESDDDSGDNENDSNDFGDDDIGDDADGNFDNDLGDTETDHGQSGAVSNSIPNGNTGSTINNGRGLVNGGPATANSPFSSIGNLTPVPDAALPGINQQ